MKLSYKITALASAVLLSLGLTACGDSVQNYRYNYDLSDYITLGAYTGIPADVNMEPVTDAEVEQQILATIMYFAKEKEVDRASAAGDTVKFSCVATLDGQEVSSYSEEEGSLVLGFEDYGEQVEAALTGVKAGDTVSAERTLSASLTDEDLAGKTISYDFTITGVYEMTPQTYNDIFVKAYFDFDTVEEYEAAVRAEMEYSVSQRQLYSLVAQTWPVLLENTTVVSYPEKEFNQIYDQIIYEVEYYTEAVGINFEEYTKLKYGKTEAEFREYAKTLAEDKVKEEMIVYAIARAEDLTVSEEKYQEYVQRYMEQLGFSTPEELEARYTRGAISEGALCDLVKEFVAQNADNASAQ